MAITLHAAVADLCPDRTDADQVLRDLLDTAHRSMAAETDGGTG